MSKIPGYDYLKQEGASALGVAEIAELPVVFVPMEGGWQLGVQTEALSDGLVSIFVPGAPNPHSGSVFFFSTDTVRPAGIKLATALNCLRRCGAGASALDAKWPAATPSFSSGSITLDLTVLRNWNCRVEEGRGGLRLGQSLRFPSPLVKPDVRSCRIRLSDRLHVRLTAGVAGLARVRRRTPSAPKISLQG